jgi:6-pyruvoyltetrahydropterin/6-carboxytetrahydropterin synthase
MSESTLRVTRTVRFSAAHRDVQGGMRGHDYRIDVTLAGRPDPVTGMFVNLADLDAVLQRDLVASLAGRQLDTDVAELSNRPVSCETITQFAVERLSRSMPAFAPANLHAVRVHESDDLYAEWERG